MQIIKFYKFLLRHRQSNRFGDVNFVAFLIIRHEIIFSFNFHEPVLSWLTYVGKIITVLLSIHVYLELQLFHATW